MTRRGALAGLAGFLAGSPFLQAQEDPWPLSRQKRVLGLKEMRTVWDFEAVFRENVNTAVYVYTAEGAGTEWSLRRNRHQFDWVDLVPGKAVDPKSVNLATEVYGTKMNIPLMVAPTANHGQLHPEGEAATHVGASGAGTPYIIASGPSVPVEKIAEAGKGPMWFQLYGLREPEANRDPLERAQAVGCQAIVITVDQQARGYPRATHVANLGGLVRPAGPGRGGRGGRGAPPPSTARYPLYRINSGREWMDWRWIDEIRKFVKVPMLIKGIMTAEDAQICVGRDLGIIVSNHGGRSLDYGMGTLEVLPEILDVVRGRVPVLIDSGFRRGTDILKALAMGANAVCVGRAQRWGLGAFGAPGTQRVLEILQAELLQAAAANGHTSLASINKSAVKVHFS